MEFTDTERAVCRHLIPLALAEDLGPIGDVTIQAVVGPQGSGSALFVARSDGVLAGLEAATLTFQAIDSSVKLERLREDGETAAKGESVAGSGPLASLLLGEGRAQLFAENERRHPDAGFRRRRRRHLCENRRHAHRRRPAFRRPRSTRFAVRQRRNIASASFDMIPHQGQPPRLAALPIRRPPSPRPLRRARAYRLGHRACRS